MTWNKIVALAAMTLMINCGRSSLPLHNVFQSKEHYTGKYLGIIGQVSGINELVQQSEDTFRLQTFTLQETVQHSDGAAAYTLYCFLPAGDSTDPAAGLNRALINTNLHGVQRSGEEIVVWCTFDTSAYKRQAMVTADSIKIGGDIYRF